MESDDPLVQVQLIGLPVAARVRFGRHLQEITRELSLVQIGAGRRPTAPLPDRLLRIAADLDGTYATFRARPDTVVDAALAAGQDFCDVTYVVPTSAGAFLQRLGEVLEEADEFCRRERHLLSLPAPEDVVAYRRWFVAESARQLAGGRPRAWQPRASPSSSPAPAPGPPTPVPGVRPRQDPGEVVGAVVGQPLALDPVAGSVITARRHVRAVLRQLGAEDLEEFAELGVSELVTNAVLHARTVVTLTVRATPDGRVRIEVSDASDTPVQPRHVAMSSTTGRGLRLVASLSSQWGVDVPAPGGPGKTVWFEPHRSDVEPEPIVQDLDLDALLS